MKSAQLSAAVVSVAFVLVSTTISVSAMAASSPAPTTPAAASAAPAAGAPAAPKHATAAAASADTAVATVNGTPISRTVFEFYVKATTGGKTLADLPPEARSQLLDNLIRGEVLRQQAVKDGLEKREDVASQVILTKLQVLGEAEAASYLKDKPATDAQLHSEYDAQIAAMPKTQFHARHILVSSQEAAQQIIDQLKTGASFEELAKSKSIDSTKDQGGDLGWFAPNSMVKPFATAVMALKKGETTQTPVQTPYGWHVIELLDTRDEAPPQFDTVKQRVQQLVQQKKVFDYQNELMKSATIKKNL